MVAAANALEAVVVEARSPHEVVEERGNERRRVHGQLLVAVSVAGRELVRAGVMTEAVDGATQNDEHTTLDVVLEKVVGL